MPTPSTLPRLECETSGLKRPIKHGELVEIADLAEVSYEPAPGIFFTKPCYVFGVGTNERMYVATSVDRTQSGLGFSRPQLAKLHMDDYIDVGWIRLYQSLEPK